jgi:hypothetical protein
VLVGCGSLKVTGGAQATKLVRMIIVVIIFIRFIFLLLLLVLYLKFPINFAGLHFTGKEITKLSFTKIKIKNSTNYCKRKN